MDPYTTNEIRVVSSPESNGNGGVFFSAAATSQATASMPSTACYSNPMNNQARYTQQQDTLPYMMHDIGHGPITPPSSDPMTSRKVPETKEDDSSPVDQKILGIPKKNSRGKTTSYKCKRCSFVATTKIDFWQHSRIHMKEDKVLTCPKCPFVTHLKHHMDFHMRNHEGSKPYECSLCDYSCVNKSMLISHQKSHSNIYQFSCGDCNYATKYYHSLKLHLRKYEHTQKIILNADGTPNPSRIIDVYGTKRGPKMKQQSQKPTEATTPGRLQPEPIIPFTPNPLVLNANPQVQSQCSPLFPYHAGRVLENFQAVTHTFQAAEKNVSSMLLTVEPTSNNESSGDEEDGCFTTIFENVEVVQDMNPEDANNTVTNNNNQNSCQFCGLTLGDPTMYTIHMGYHGISNSFTSIMTPEECKDMLSIQLHLARQSHIQLPTLLRRF